MKSSTTTLNRLLATLVFLVSLTQGVLGQVVVETIDPYKMALVKDLGNNVHVIDLALPNNKGISVNQMTTFSLSEGIIVLNNSRTSKEIEGVGFVDANLGLSSLPDLQGVVIEVAGLQPSILKGKIIVADSSAKVSVVNPKGVTADGLSFENTLDVELTAQSSGDVQISSRGISTPQGLLLQGNKVGLDGTLEAGGYVEIKSLAHQPEGDGKQMGVWSTDAANIKAGALGIFALDKDSRIGIEVPSFEVHGGGGVELHTFGGQVYATQQMIAPDSIIDIKGRTVYTNSPDESIPITCKRLDLQIEQEGWLNLRKNVYATEGVNVNGNGLFHHKGSVNTPGYFTVSMDGVLVEPVYSCEGEGCDEGNGVDVKGESTGHVNAGKIDIKARTGKVEVHGGGEVISTNAQPDAFNVVAQQGIELSTHKRQTGEGLNKDGFAYDQSLFQSAHDMNLYTHGGELSNSGSVIDSGGSLRGYGPVAKVESPVEEKFVTHNEEKSTGEKHRRVKIGRWLEAFARLDTGQMANSIGSIDVKQIVPVYQTVTSQPIIRCGSQNKEGNVCIWEAYTGDNTLKNVILLLNGDSSVKAGRDVLLLGTAPYTWINPQPPEGIPTLPSGKAILAQIEAKDKEGDLDGSILAVGKGNLKIIAGGKVEVEGTTIVGEESVDIEAKEKATFSETVHTTKNTLYEKNHEKVSHEIKINPTNVIAGKNATVTAPQVEFYGSTLNVLNGTATINGDRLIIEDAVHQEIDTEKHTKRKLLTKAEQLIISTVTATAKAGIYASDGVYLNLKEFIKLTGGVIHAANGKFYTLQGVELYLNPKVVTEYLTIVSKTKGFKIPGIAQAVIDVADGAQPKHALLDNIAYIQSTKKALDAQSYTDLGGPMQWGIDTYVTAGNFADTYFATGGDFWSAVADTGRSELGLEKWHNIYRPRSLTYFQNKNKQEQTVKRVMQPVLTGKIVELNAKEIKGEGALIRGEELLKLKVTGNVDLKSATEESTTRSSDRTWNIGIDRGAASTTLRAGYDEHTALAERLTQISNRLESGQKVEVEIGGDMTLEGQLTGPEGEVKVAGRVILETPQDLEKLRERSWGAGASVTLYDGVWAVDGGVHGNRGQGQGSSQEAHWTSGFHFGELDMEASKLELAGSIIQGKGKLKVGEITFRDVHDNRDYKSWSLGAGTSSIGNMIPGLDRQERSGGPVRGVVDGGYKKDKKRGVHHATLDSELELETDTDTSHINRNPSKAYELTYEKKRVYSIAIPILDWKKFRESNEKIAAAAKEIGQKAKNIFRLAAEHTTDPEIKRRAEAMAKAQEEIEKAIEDSDFDEEEKESLLITAEAILSSPEGAYYIQALDAVARLMEKAEAEVTEDDLADLAEYSSRGMVFNEDVEEGSVEVEEFSVDSELYDKIINASVQTAARMGPIGAVEGFIQCSSPKPKERVAGVFKMAYHLHPFKNLIELLGLSSELMGIGVEEGTKIALPKAYEYWPEKTQWTLDKVEWASDTCEWCKNAVKNRIERRSRETFGDEVVDDVKEVTEFYASAFSEGVGERGMRGITELPSITPIGMPAAGAKIAAGGVIGVVGVSNKIAKGAKKILVYQKMSDKTIEEIKRGTKLGLKELENIKKRKGHLNINEYSAKQGLKLIEKGENIWEIDHTLRGQAIEFIMAKTYFAERGYGHVGNLRGGFFFTDFGDKVSTVSLKSVDTIRNVKWKGQIKNDIQKLFDQGEHLLGVDDRVAIKSLHMVVPGGEIKRLAKDLQEIKVFGTSLDIKIVVTEY